MGIVCHTARFPLAAPAGLSGNHLLNLWGSSHTLGRAEQSDLSAPPLDEDAELPTLMDGTFTNTWIWTGSVFAQLTKSNNGATAGQFGMEFAAAVRRLREGVSGNIYIIKNAASGAGVDTFVPGGSQYNSGITEFDQAIAWLASNSVTLNSQHWSWFSTADTSMSQGDYETKLRDIMAELETDGVRVTGGRSLIFQAPTGSTGDTAAMRAAKTAVATDDPSTIFAIDVSGGVDYLKPDNLHQEGRGQMENGNQLMQYLLGLPSLPI